MSALCVASVTAAAPAKRSDDRDGEHPANDPVNRPKQPGHCRL